MIGEAFDTSWVSTVGENIEQLEKAVCEQTKSKYAVALASHTDLQQSPPSLQDTEKMPVLMPAGPYSKYHI